MAGTSTTTELPLATLTSWCQEPSREDRVTEVAAPLLATVTAELREAERGTASRPESAAPGRAACAHAWSWTRALDRAGYSPPLRTMRTAAPTGVLEVTCTP